MVQVGAFEAKTHFSQLLAKVMQGEEVEITKHGRKVAMIVPIQRAKKEDKVAEAIKGIKRLRQGNTLGPDLTIKQLREEGRR